MNNSTFTYKLIRVDRDIRKYIDNRLLDNGFTKNYVVEKDQVIDRYKFNFSITTLRSSIGHSNNGIHPVINYLSKKYRDDFYHDLYASGNDKSELQKVWGFVKHIIPFYDCIEGIVNNNAVQAVLACMMDIIALIPVAGKAANMAGKFGTGLEKGLRYGSRTLMRGKAGDAGTIMLREIRLPHVNEFLGLSKNALRAVDPGFELLSKGGKFLDRKLESFLRMKQNNVPLADKISSFRTAENLPLTTKTYTIARLLHSEINVPIQKVGADSRGEYYSLVNPETGVLFPVREMAALAHEHGALFHCDAVQAVGEIPIVLSSSEIDMLSCLAHKIDGPKGVGCLYLKRSTRFLPLLRGGHQERGRRACTENIAGIVGMGSACASSIRWACSILLPPSPASAPCDKSGQGKSKCTPTTICGWQRQTLWRRSKRGQRMSTPRC